MNDDFEEQGLDLRDYWRIVVRGRWYIVVAFVVVVASTAFFSFMADPVYQGSGQVLVLTNQDKTLATELSLPASLSGNVRNEVPNWIQMMTSRSALEKAIADLSQDPSFIAERERERQASSFWSRLLGQVKASEQTAQPPTKEELLTLKQLQQQIAVSNIRGTDVIEVKATGGTPLQAQLVTNALLNAYLELDREIAKTTLSATKSFIEGRLQQTEANLTELEQSFSQFKHENQLDLGLQPLEQEISQLQQTKAKLNAQLLTYQGKLRAAEQLLSQVKPPLLEEDFPAEVDPGERAQWTTLRANLSPLEQARLNALEAKDFQATRVLTSKIVKQGQGAKGTLLSPLFAQYVEQIQAQQDLQESIAQLGFQFDEVQTRLDQETKKLATYRLSYDRFGRDIDVTQSLYTLLKQEYEKARIADVGELGGLRVVGWAVEPETPIKPKKRLNLMLGSLVGLMLGLGFAFLREYLDNTFKTPSQLEKELGVPNLGVVFAVEGFRSNHQGPARQLEKVLVAHFDPNNPLVNAHLGIEASLRFSSIDHPPKTLMVTSAQTKEGKSSLVANLGLVFSHAGLSTVIVDSDLRKSIFYRLFGLPRNPGLSEVALGEADLDEVIVAPYTLSRGSRAAGRGLLEFLINMGKINRQDLDAALQTAEQEDHQRSLEQILIEQGKLTHEDVSHAHRIRQEGLQNFHVLVPGKLPPNPTEFLGSKRFKKIVDQLKSRFDMVLFDSSPLTSVPDATILSTQVDGTILVVQAERTEKALVQHTIDQLKKSGCTLLGTVLTQAKASTLKHYGGAYGYGYYYGSYQDEKTS